MRPARSLLALAAVLALGASQPSPARAQLEPAPGSSSQGWAFTDDLGVTVELDAQPQRIVAQVTAAATLHDYGIEPVATFGITTRPDGAPENTAGISRSTTCRPSGATSASSTSRPSPRPSPTSS